MDAGGKVQRRLGGSIDQREHEIVKYSSHTTWTEEPSIRTFSFRCSDTDRTHPNWFAHLHPVSSVFFFLRLLQISFFYVSSLSTHFEAQYPLSN
ncbi:hypothetical protein M514_07490, partial [Trichuris suis]